MKGRTNSYTKQKFLDLIARTSGHVFGVGPQEEITDIKVLNNTVIIKIEPKIMSRRGR